MSGPGTVGDEVTALLMRVYELEDQKRIILEEKRVIEKKITELNDAIRIATMESNQQVLIPRGG